MPRTVAFLKLTGFYAGTARRAASLSGPILVGRRGVVLEASGDLAAAGLRAGLSRREAAYAAPEAHWVEYRPERFRPAAEVFWRRCLALTPRVEPLAENEVFLDLTGTPGFTPAVAAASTALTALTAPGVLAALATLTADLRRELGIADLELRAGLAASRLVARLAAGRLEGEGRLCAGSAGEHHFSVPPGAEADFLGPLPPTALWTLPAAVGETLTRLGLHTLAEVREVPELALRRLFGPQAFLLRRHASGQDDSPVPLFDQALSAWAGAAPRLVREIEFLPPPANWPEVAGLLQEAARELAVELRAEAQSCLRLHLCLELADGTSRSARRMPREPLTSAGALAAALEEAVTRLFEPGSSRGSGPATAVAPAPPRRLRIEAEPARTAGQLSLLAGPFAVPCGGPRNAPAGAPSALRAGALGEVLAAVNRAFSAEVLFPAARLEPSRRERLRRLIPGFGHAAP